MLKNIVRAWILISSHLRTSVTFTNLCLPLSYELQIFLKILTSSSEYWYPRSIAKLINLRLTNQWLHIATDTYNTRPVRKLVYNGCIFVSLFLSLIRTVYTETVCSPAVSPRVPLKCLHIFPSLGELFCPLLLDVSVLCHPAIVLKLAIIYEFVGNDNLSKCCVWDV